MLQRVQSFLAHFDHSSAEQERNEAILDLLLLTMLVDGVVRQSEEQQIAQVARGLAWHAPEHVDSYLDARSGIIRAAIGDEIGTYSLLESIHLRLGGPEEHAKALRAATELAQADGVLDDAERRFLAALRKAFHLG